MCSFVLSDLISVYEKMILVGPTCIMWVQSTAAQRRCLSVSVFKVETN